MLASFALAIVALAGLFLAALGALGFGSPSRVRRFLGGFAATSGRHYAELAGRMVVGAALVVAAPRLAGSPWVAAAGWVLLVTTAVMLCVPWHAHRAFAQRVVPVALTYLPVIATVSLSVGCATLWAALAAAGSVT